MTLSTEYRGYTISYSENEDKWRCYDVGAESEKLSSVKRKIDTMHRKMRKENSVPCLDVSTYSGVRAVEAVIVEYLGPIRQTKSFERVGTGDVIDHEVAYMSNKTSLSKTPSRQKGRLSSLFAETPENLQAIEDMKAIDGKIKALDEERKTIAKSMRSISFEEIKPIVEASGFSFTEGD